MAAFIKGSSGQCVPGEVNADTYTADGELLGMQSQRTDWGIHRMPSADEYGQTGKLAQDAGNSVAPHTFQQTGFAQSGSMQTTVEQTSWAVHFWNTDMQRLLARSNAQEFFQAGLQLIEWQMFEMGLKLIVREMEDVVQNETQRAAISQHMTQHSDKLRVLFTKVGKSWLTLHKELNSIKGGPGLDDIAQHGVGFQCTLRGWPVFKVQRHDTRPSGESFCVLCGLRLSKRGEGIAKTRLHPTGCFVFQMLRKAVQESVTDPHAAAAPVHAPIPALPDLFESRAATAAMPLLTHLSEAEKITAAPPSTASMPVAAMPQTPVAETPQMNRGSALFLQDAQKISGSWPGTEKTTRKVAPCAAADRAPKRARLKKSDKHAHAGG